MDWHQLHPAVLIQWSVHDDLRDNYYTALEEKAKERHEKPLLLALKLAPLIEQDERASSACRDVAGRLEVGAMVRMVNGADAGCRCQVFAGVW